MVRRANRASTAVHALLGLIGLGRRGGGAAPAPGPGRLDLRSEVFRQDPYPHYRALRQQAPVLWVPEARAWLVSRHADALRMLKDPECFSSRLMAPADPVLLGADPPAHTRVRRIVARALSRRTAGLDGTITAVATGLVAGLREEPRPDLVRDLAEPLSMTIIAEILGIAEAERARLKGWSNAVVANAAGAGDAGDVARIAELEAYLAQLIAERTDRPGEYFVSALIGEPGDRLPAREVLSLAKLMLIAGNETTANLVGNAVLALLQHPAELVKVRAQPDRIPALVEAVLRYDTPVQFVQRQARREVVLSGTAVPAGGPVMVLLGSANRDEAHFADAESFRVLSEHPEHLSFGAGIHACPGAALARKEAAAALRALLPHLPVPSKPWSPEVPRVPSMQLRGPRELRVALAARAGT